MTNQEQLAILKQGVEVWNKWREGNASLTVDLDGASFEDANLYKANLEGAKLRGADFGRAKLMRADLFQADLSGAILIEANLKFTDLGKVNLMGADLRRADLIRANLRRADLSEAILRGAYLSKADLTRANLFGTDFSGADLSLVNLSKADFTGSKFWKAVVGGTIFGDSDLSETIGLEDVSHWGPSSISTDVFTHSRGKIPEVFLHGCGLSDWEVELVKFYDPDLSNEEKNNILYKMYGLLAGRALQTSPLFISYSHADGAFVDKLDNNLDEKGIRFWRDVHDMKSGRIETQLDQAIRQNPTVLLILSENSLKSDWVEHEVRTARELEKVMGRDALCPVALDDSWKDSPWPKRVMEQVMEYNILDFSDWKDDSKFGSTFNKLIDGLELFYKG